MKHLKFRAAAVAVFAILATSVAQAEDLKTFEWKGVSFSYPQSWKLQQGAADNQDAVNLQLLSESTPPVSLIINLNADKSMQGGTAEQSGKIGEAFCLPIALQLAEKAEQRIYHMPSRIQVAGKTMKSVSIVVEREAQGQKTFNNLHCFAGLGDGRVAVGAIISAGVPGQIMQQQPFLDATGQAYDIVDSIRFQ
jgi:hypothetical protein